MVTPFIVPTGNIIIITKQRTIVIFNSCAYLFSSNSADWFTLEYGVDKFSNKRPTTSSDNQFKRVIPMRHNAKSVQQNTTTYTKSLHLSVVTCFLHQSTILP